MRRYLPLFIGLPLIAVLGIWFYLASSDSKRQDAIMALDRPDGKLPIPTAPRLVGTNVGAGRRPSSENLASAEDWVDRALRDLWAQLAEANTRAEQIGLIKNLLARPLETSTIDAEEITRGAAILHLARLADEDPALAPEAFNLAIQALAGSFPILQAYAIVALFPVPPEYRLSTRLPEAPDTRFSSDMALTAIPDGIHYEGSWPTMKGIAEGNPQVIELLERILRAHKTPNDRLAIFALHQADQAEFATRVESLDLLRKPWRASDVADLLLEVGDERSRKIVVDLESEKLTERVGLCWVSIRLARAGHVNLEAMERALTILQASDGPWNTPDRIGAIEYASEAVRHVPTDTARIIREALGQRISDSALDDSEKIIREAARTMDVDMLPYLRRAAETCKHPYLVDLLQFGLEQLEPNSSGPVSLSGQYESLRRDYERVKRSGESDERRLEAWDRMLAIRNALASLKQRE
jgi:hypothetical protein